MTAAVGTIAKDAHRILPADEPTCGGDSVWAAADSRWQAAQGRTAESLHAAMQEALQQDLERGPRCDLTTIAFAMRLNRAVVSSSIFHLLLGFAVTPACPAFTGQLNIGGRDYGVPVAFTPGALVPALTLGDGTRYAIPALEYHEVRLLGAPTDGSVYAVGVRISRAATKALAMRPNNAGGEVAFATGCAMLPSEVYSRIPPLATQS